MYSASVLPLLLFTAGQVAYSVITDGLLPNGNFERGPNPKSMKGSQVKEKHAIPEWEISGFVECIKTGQTQGDMLLVVPKGVEKSKTYAITFNVALTWRTTLEFCTVAMIGMVFPS